jgi:membrane protein
MASAVNFFRKIRRFVYQATVVISTRYYDDALSLHAANLTYNTLLSLVPFLAVAFSVLRAFGVENFLQPLLAQILEPLGSGSVEITNRIVKFVENIRAGILGAAGLAMLFYTVVMLVANIEDALNIIWRAPRSRSWGQRFTAYLSIVLVGPVMVFTAFALTASAQSYWLVERLIQIKVVGELFILVTSVMPFLLLSATFTFLYKLLPATRVRLGSALIGGATAAILWQLAGSAFAAFVANSARYAAIYSGFAVVVVFLVWLYVGWLIFLLGAEVAYFHQHPHAFVRESLHRGRGHLFQEWLALSVLVEVSRRHLSGRPPWQPAELAAFLGVSGLGNIIDKFVCAGILVKSAEPEGIVLAQPPENVRVKKIFDIVADADFGEIKKDGPVADVLMRRDRAVQEALDGVTLRSLASESRDKKPEAHSVSDALVPDRSWSEEKLRHGVNQG